MAIVTQEQPETTTIAEAISTITEAIDTDRRTVRGLVMRTRW
jgi:hypothetical protein